MTPLSSHEGPEAGMVTNPPSEPVLPTAQQSSAPTQATALRLSSPLIGGLGTSWKPAPESWAIAGEVAFAAKIPGHILPLEIGPGHEVLIHRHGFLCATPQIQLGVGFQQSLGAGIFGGDCFLLQKVSGLGTAWLELGGEVVVRDLQPGETLRVHPGHVGAFQSSVSFQITRIQGIRNMFFGGDGIFLAALTGPGRVWLQTLPLSNLAHALEPYLPAGRSDAGKIGAASVVGGIVGSMFDR